MFTIRPYTVADYDDFVCIDNATQSTAFWGEADWQPVHPPRGDATDAKRYVVVDNESSRIVGYGAVMLTEPSNIDVMVDPAWQRRGIGKMLWKQMVQDLASLGTMSLNPWVRAENNAGCRFVESLGFININKEGPVQLSVRDTDLSRFLSVAERLIQHGITLTTLADEKENPEFLRKFYHLLQEVEKDVPGYLPANRTTYERCLYDLGQPGMSLETVFIAKHREEYVGLSMIGRRVTPGDIRFAGSPYCFNQHLTGVHPDYRRRGIALALKVHALVCAKRQGCDRILTNSDNPAMRDLNSKLGFRAGPWLVYSLRRK